MIHSKYCTLSALALSLLIGCGRTHESNEVQTASTDISDYAGASCHFKFDEGGAALPVLASDVIETSFGKKFDRSLLDPVLRASAAEVIRFAEAHGVRYFKTANHPSANSCAFAATVPEAPPDLSAEFEAVGASGDTTGLYLPLHSPNLPSTNDFAAIVVHNDTNKWVLVHEYMHHLFELQRAAEGIRSLELEANFASTYEDFNLAHTAAHFASGPAKVGKIKDAVAKLHAFNEAALVFLKTNALEEMTIESYLARLLDHDLLAFVHQKQRVNSAMYVMISAKGPSTMLAQLRTLNAGFAKEFDVELDSIYEARAELIRLDEPLADCAAEVLALTTEARNYMAAQGYSETNPGANQGVLRTHGNSVLTCGHERDLTDAIAKINSLLVGSAR